MNHQRLASVSAALVLLTGCMATSQRGVGGSVPFPGGPGLDDPMPTPVATTSVPQAEGFSSAMKVGLTVYIAGQVALDSTKALIGAGNVKRQLQQAFDNVFAITRAARGVPADLVKVTVYVVRLEPGHVSMVRDVLGLYFPPQSTPAVTIVGIDRLPQEEWLVAVDGTAVLRGEFPDRERDRPYQRVR